MPEIAKAGDAMSLIPVWVKELIAAAIFAAVVIGAIALHHSIYQEGFNASKAISDKEKSDITAKALSTQLAYEAVARAKEQALAAQLSDLSTKHEESEAHANTVINGLRADVRAGAIKLSVPTRCASPATSAHTDTAVASKSSDEGRSELMPETAETILSIAGGIAASVRKSNELIDAYNAVRVA